MAGNTLTTKAVVIGQDRLTGPLQKMANRVSGIQAQMMRSQQAMARTARNLGGAGSIAGLGATAAASSFLRSQFDIEKAMNRARAIVPDQENFVALAEKQRQLAQKYPATILDLANASIEMGQASLKASTQINLMEPAIRGAMAAGTDIPTVAKGVTDVIMGLGLAFKTAKEQSASFDKINNLLAAGSISANQPYEDFLATMQKIAPVAAAVGASAHDITVLGGALANAGIKGAKAGTALRTLFVRPLSPTKKALGLLQKYNINLDDFIEKSNKIGNAGKLRNFLQTTTGLDIKPLEADLQKIISDPRLAGNTTAMAQKLTGKIVEDLGAAGTENAPKIATAVADFVKSGFQRLRLVELFKELGDKNASVALFKELFGLRHIEKAQALVNQVRTGALSELDQKLRHNNRVDGLGRDAVTRISEDQMSGYYGAMTRFSSSLKNLFRTVAKSGVLDELTKIADNLREFTNSLSSSNPAMLKWVGLSVVFVGALAPLGFAIAGVTAAISPFVGALALLAGGAARIASLTAAAAAALPVLRKLPAALMGVGAAATSSGAWVAMLGRLRTALMFTGVGGAIVAVLANLREIGSYIQGLGSGMLKGWSDQIIEDGGGNVVGVVEGLGSKLQRLSETIFGKSNSADLAKWFNSGKSAGEQFMGLLGKIVDLINRAVKGLQDMVREVVKAVTEASKALGLTPQTPEERRQSIQQSTPGNQTKTFVEKVQAQSSKGTGLGFHEKLAIRRIEMDLKRQPTVIRAQRAPRDLPKLQTLPTVSSKTRSTPMDANSGTRQVQITNTVPVTNTQPLKLDGRINSNVNVTVQGGGNANATSSGNIKGPANAIPVVKSNNSRTGS